MKVIIVGGGIAGLTFANAMERAGIDFVLLERRAVFDPQVGASIGMGAGAMRVFDQFGAAQAIIDNTVPLRLGRHHRKDGSLIMPPTESFQLLTKRFFYGVCFLDRQWVLRALYNTIAQKDKMLLNKQLRSIDQSDASVNVHCEDGTSYTGDIVVGCDGVNSKVRTEMWRLATLSDSSYFSDEERTKMTAEYTCLFGIADGPISGLKAGDIDNVYDKDYSFLIITGKGGRVYFFFFRKLDRKYHYHMGDFPKFSKADAEKVAMEHAWRKVTEHLTLGDIWERTVSYTLVPMEEALFKKWSWGRIATIGDNAHKMTANHGQAGNNAIESATALANELKRIDDAGDVTSATISLVFKNWQEKRQCRIEASYKEAADVARMQSLQTPNHYFTVFVVLRYAADLIVNMFTDVVIGSEVLEYLPLTDRSFDGTCPFNPKQGTGYKESILKRCVKALPLLGASYLAFQKTDISNLEQSMLNLLQPTSVSNCDWLSSFSFLVTTSLIYSIWLIESNRRANALSLPQLPALFAILAHVWGLGTVAPWLYFFHYMGASIYNFAPADARLTNVAYTRTILPIMLSYVLGPLLLKLSGHSVDIAAAPQTWHYIWFFAPLGISITQWTLVNTGISTTDILQDATNNWLRDLPLMRSCVYTLSAISGMTWLYNMAQSLIAADFAPAGTSLEATHAYLILTTTLWLTLLISDLKRAGMVGDSWINLISTGLMLAVVGGPAASLAMAWLWREQILATTREKNAMTRERYAGKTVLEVDGRDAKTNGHVAMNGSTKVNDKA